MSACQQQQVPSWVEILLHEPESGKNPAYSAETKNKAGAATTCLVMIAHGSRDPRWREPFERLYATVRRTTSRNLKLAYMEFTSPTLMECAEEAAREGVTELNILPVFMAAGAHLATDVPEQAQQVRERFPQMRVTVLNPLGEDRRMFSLMCEIVREKIA